ncbi:nuclear transport factor 2 family protein [Formosa sediminum]|uniref:Nuclear transport factor 2 family protein n=1 Tax=Formosa sediminum TaxID=2594004 RepID=A0A516GP54_9FLAO|nr:nuclear transport factor 2 family protein [Formosa sediminum]QDO93301.1 nuclear transport factor 2 family protein [Formosa sediminum]
MRYLKSIIFGLTLCVIGISNLQAQDLKAKTSIHTNLDAWHKAAAKAAFNSYFNLMTKDAVFVGTDASEHWELEAFKAYSKPYFDAGKAWSFSALERHIYVVNDSLAWFDELLDTQMGVCRGSGVMKYEKGTWKVAHYVLSATIPNNQMDTVTALKSVADSTIISSLTK